MRVVSVLAIILVGVLLSIPAAGLAQTGDDSSQISYSAGYSTGLLLQDTDKTSVAFTS